MDERDRMDAPPRRDDGHVPPRDDDAPPTASMPAPLDRWGPASYWRLGLVALLAVMVVLLVMGGGFWQAEPVDVPR